MTEAVNFTKPEEDYSVNTVELYEDGDYVATLRVDELEDVLDSIIDDEFNHVTGIEDGLDYQKLLVLRVLKGMLTEKLEELS
jgi:hypothetical protein